MYFVAYDIKGIQKSIFSVPKLKCIVGTSGDVFQLDGKFGGYEKTIPTVKKILAAGGRGVFEVADESTAKAMAGKIVREANAKGFDVRIGMHENLKEATLRADQLYPSLPKDLEGHPCAESGIWPAGKNRKVNRIIRQRILDAKNDHLGTSILKDLQGGFAERVPGNATMRFIKNVNPEFEEHELSEGVPAKDYKKRLERIARTAQAVIGGRNRWAIVALDGNDIGQLYDNLLDEHKDAEQYSRELKRTSDELSRITKSSFMHALNACLEYWYSDILRKDFSKCICPDMDGSEQLLLPFRPLILGGDDVVLLCHATLAMKFIELMSAEFTRLAGLQKDAFACAKGQTLTMSAGVLFCKTSLPLHTAIPYAERLLANAKGRYRNDSPNHATPAAVDWETITDTMIDSPTARRNRDLRFIDNEINRTVHLTRRPYLLRPAEYDPGKQYEACSLKHLFKDDKDEKGSYALLKELPTSFRAELKSRLKLVWSERMRYLISIAKDERYAALSKSLRQSHDGSLRTDTTGEGSAWLTPKERKTDSEPWVEKKDGGKTIQSTDVLDAILLLDEEHRGEQGAKS